MFGIKLWDSVREEVTYKDEEGNGNRKLLLQTIKQMDLQNG